jgi:two-component system nitrogen regulation sensor histidine kinase NtrY
MKVTRLNKINEKLTIKSGTDELHDLITAYNGMMEELEENAVKLATSERESAWREMAKQVAHEIKNPLDANAFEYSKF